MMTSPILISSVIAIVIAAILVYLNLQMLRMKCQCKMLGCKCPPNYALIAAVAAVIGCICYVVCVYM